MNALEEDNRSYNKKLRQIQRECKELIKQNEHLFNEQEYTKDYKFNFKEEEDDPMKTDLLREEKINDSSCKNINRILNIFR